MGTDYMSELDFKTIIQTNFLSERANNGAIWWDAEGSKKGAEIFGEYLSWKGWWVFIYGKASS